MNVPVPCRIESPAAVVESVVVHPRGAAPFEVALTGVTAVAYPPLESEASDAPIVDVLAAVHFVARGKAVSYSVARPTSAARGMAALEPRTRLEHVRARGSGAVADVALAGEVRVRGVELGCDAIDLLAGEEDNVESHEDDGPSLAARRREILLYPDAAQRGRALRLEASSPSALTFLDLGGSGAMAHVALTTMGGSSFEGWVWRGDVTPTQEGALLALSGTGGSGCDGGVGSLGLHQFRGPASVRAGATIYAAEGSGAWGTATGESLVVLHTSGEPFARVLEIRGVGTTCGDLDNAYIDARDVYFPAKHAR